MAQSLRNLRHEVVSLDAADGTVLPAGQEETAARPTEVLRSLPLAAMARLANTRELLTADVVVIALHGTWGEDGTIQGLLELLGKPYTGSGVMASALAMNKAMSKRVFAREGIPTPAWMLAEHNGLIHSLARTGVVPPPVLRIGMPVVVKPNEEGSTVGLAVVGQDTEFLPAFEVAARFGGEVLIEQYVPGRELTVAVVGNEALPIVEIRPKGGLYDYAAKYTPGGSEYQCPARLPEELTERICELGVQAAKALDCRGVSRADFRLSPDNEPLCLEVNTIPGMTPTSLVPMAAKAKGISYDQLVARMVELALADHAPRSGEPARA